MGVTMAVEGKLGAAVRFDPPSTTGVDAPNAVPDLDRADR